MDENPYLGPGTRGTAPGKKSVPAKAFTLLLVLGIVGLAILFLLPAVRFARPAARRNVCTNNMKQISLALRSYADTFGSLPPAYTTDAEGRPLHSWRTLILPFMEEGRLYNTIDLTKPWDDPVNAKARETQIDLYRCPENPDDDNLTNYLAVVGPNSCFLSDAPRKLADITDGARETLMVVEVDADHAVPWMSPVDADEPLVLGLEPKSKLAHTGGFTAAFVDGHVSFLNVDLSAAQRRALISIAGNDKAILGDTD